MSRFMCDKYGSFFPVLGLFVQFVQMDFIQTVPSAPSDNPLDPNVIPPAHTRRELVYCYKMNKETI
jgi:hypothetical protein